MSLRGLTIVATGPLTSDALAAEIQRLSGTERLFFFDSISPIVEADSIDHSKVYMAARYDKGTADYINCPMMREEYEAFFAALAAAQPVDGHDWDKAHYFEGCLPIEEIARRGPDTLRFGPMKPVGLRNPRTGNIPYAVVQLRQENLRADSYNLVGFQNHLKFGEQARVLRMIPGLENAKFLRYGQIHRNTYINAPALLDAHPADEAAPAPHLCRTNLRRRGLRRIHRHRPARRSHRRRPGRGGQPNPSLRPAPAPTARSPTTSATPTPRISSPPTSPSTCWSSSTKPPREKCATKNFATRWSANALSPPSPTGSSNSQKFPHALSLFT